MNILEIWIKKIQTDFKGECPNGFLLNWDMNRFFDLLKGLSNGCKVINQTDFNYSYCNSYEITPNSSNQKYIYELTLNISFIVDAFVFYWTIYSKNMRKGEIIPQNEIEVDYDPTADVKNLMKKNGFIEVPEEWYEIIIDGVQLELSEKATLGKCLFHDYEK